MSCQRSEIGPVTVWTCGRRKPEDAPVCEVCKAHRAITTCGFELRGAKLGLACGKRLCRKCAGDSVLCPPHRNLVTKGKVS